MRKAEAILDIIRNRGGRGLPLDDVYRQLFNPDLYLLAYGKIYRNAGALTPGATPETVDGMSLEKIQKIIELLRYERYRWTPVRRVYIEKKNSTKKRPLGMPTWSDKLLQEVIRLILDAYYEPQFCPTSHGFRPGRGCHTALGEIYRKWPGTVWFIEGDISRCYDSLDHAVLLSILREKIRDNRFLRLIENLLKAGYLEAWRYNPTYSGVPQGGIVSPILANIYLDRLDTFVEQTLGPQYNRGTKRKANLTYVRLRRWCAREKKARNWETVKELEKQHRTLPSLQTDDPDFRRLRYVRYADDWLVGFIGPRSEGVEIKRKLGEFLNDQLKLELSEEKTVITHARSEPARFLGYDIRVIAANSYLRAYDYGKRRSRNGGIALEVPPEVVRQKCQTFLRNGKPMHRTGLANESVYAIIDTYQREYRGFVEYYQLAHNRSTRLTCLKWTMERSLTRTLARKLRISVRHVYQRFTTMIRTHEGDYKGLEARVEREGKRPLTARWGGIPLKRRTHAVLDDQLARRPTFGNEIVDRLLQRTCELCGSQDRLNVHHIRHLKDLHRAGRRDKPAWVQAMIRRQRKSLIVCHQCHQDIHTGRVDGPVPLRKRTETLESWVQGKLARPVRRGAVGKVPTHR